MTLTDDDFLRDFHEMSQFGATPRGGVEREAGTTADHETRRWFDGWLRAHGFETRLDEIGNQFGLAELVPGAPWVLVGSHLDSQPLAGRFDGAYGVLVGAYAAARAVARAASGEYTPTHNIAVVNWFNEEGSRFTPSMMGSAVFTGLLPLQTALDTTDLQGATVREALAASHAPLEEFEFGPLGSYAEIHIEQGRILEEEGATIGLVDRTWAASKYQVVVTGEQAHTGSTIMADRRDALYGASLLIAAARELADEFDEGQLHSSVSQLTVLPNSPVVIAREVRMNLDLRSPDEAVLAEAMRRLDEKSAVIAERARVDIERNLTHQWGLLEYQRAGVELSRAVAADLGLPHREIMTVAGHDSTNMKDAVPTVMLFVPSVSGVSHNELEHTDDADSVAGLAMFSAVTERMLTGALEGVPLH